MKESHRSRRRGGFLPSVTMKHMLLETAIGKGRLGKRKDTVNCKRLPLTNIADRRKRKFPRMSEERAGVRSKRAKFSNNLGGSNSAVDYISELPDCLIHNILSFLHTKDAARMSILSKRWRQAWHSFPQLEIDHRLFSKHGGDLVVKLKTHIDSVLQRFASQMVNIDRFRLCITGDPVLRILTDIWIESATRRNLKELYMQVKSDWPVKFQNEKYSLPPCVLSITTLSVLSLHGCNLETCDDINLPLLQKLSLKKLRVSDVMLEKLISSCPLIDDLRLVECTELHFVNISGPTKLRKFHLYQCRTLVSVKIASPVLQSFWLHQSNRIGLEPHINLEGCTSLREVVMEYPQLLKGDFLNVIESPITTTGVITGGIVRSYEVPLLEKLVLSKVSYLFDLQISGEKLTKLALRDLHMLDQLSICAPQLISLEYKGKDIPITLVGPTNLREANLYIKQASVGRKNCKYHELFRMLGKRGDLKLLIHDKSEATIQEDMSTIFPPMTVGLEFRTIKVSTSIDYLIDGVLTAHKYPSKLSLFSHKGSKLHKAVNDKLNAGRKDLSCCSYFKNKCWRHYLREVSCDSSEVNRSQESGSLEAPTQPDDDWLKSCFALEWADKPGR